MKPLPLLSLTSLPSPRNMAVIFSKKKNPLTNNRRPQKFPVERPTKTRRNQSNFFSLKKRKKYCSKLLPPIIIRAAILTATNQNPKIISEKSTSCCRTSRAVFLLLLLPCSNLFCTSRFGGT